MAKKDDPQSSSEAQGRPVDVDEVDTDAGHRVEHINPADSKPNIVNDNYYQAGDDENTRQRQAVAAELAADDDATDAEKSSGERTISGLEPVEVVPADAVGMGGAVDIRPRAGLRALRMDRAFSAKGGKGEAGDWLVEDAEGTRTVVKGADFDREYVVG